jgi:tetratricopeptide (TPR) repeat protein
MTENGNFENQKPEKEEEEYSYEQRLEVPYLEKAKGDTQLKSRNYELAMKHYSKVIMSIKILMDDKALEGETLQKYVKEVGVPSNMNLSLCYINLKEWKTAIQHLNKVLDYDKNNVKARYRRCLCLCNSREFEKAHVDLIFLSEQIQDSIEYEELKKIYEESKIKLNNDEKKFYNKMFKEYIQGKNNFRCMIILPLFYYFIH